MVHGVVKNSLKIGTNPNESNEEAGSPDPASYRMQIAR